MSVYVCQQWFSAPPPKLKNSREGKLFWIHEQLLKIWMKKGFEALASISLSLFLLVLQMGWWWCQNSHIKAYLVQSFRAVLHGAVLTELQPSTCWLGSEFASSVSVVEMECCAESWCPPPSFESSSSVLMVLTVVAEQQCLLLADISPVRTWIYSTL